MTARCPSVADNLSHPHSHPADAGAEKGPQEDDSVPAWQRPPPGVEALPNPFYMPDPAIREAFAATLMQTMEIAARARMLRNSGNEAFREGDFARAERLYTESLAVLKDSEAVLDSVVEDPHGLDLSPLQMRVPSLCNRAAARLKLGDFKGAEADCAAVLEVRLPSRPRWPRCHQRALCVRRDFTSSATSSRALFALIDPSRFPLLLFAPPAYLTALRPSSCRSIPSTTRRSAAGPRPANASARPGMRFAT